MFLLKAGSGCSGCSDKTPYFQKLTADDENMLFFPLEKKTALWFFNDGFPETALIEWMLQNFINRDKAFIDVGAHVGTYTLRAARVAKHTYSFECSPRTFCFLAANIALHELTDKVSPLPFALGSTCDTVTYYQRSIDGGGNGVKVMKESDDHVSKTIVSQRTLDSFGISDVSCLKIDVEGYEEDVLKGATETLRLSNWPPILFESWSETPDRHDMKDIKEIRRSLFCYVQEVLGYTIIQLKNASDMFLAHKQ